MLENTDRRQIKNRHLGLLKLSTTQKKKQTTQKTATWFSRLLRHSGRKRGGFILQCPRAHTGLGSELSPVEACAGVEAAEAQTSLEPL